ncbi:hypothetical protein I2W78_09225 [Streptomyces spinoverrucosus]|uniref:hypothetical protein n=1 Tax=Streptomyces spinoverrucosus TaxID=284043 RepID=UPI0018C39056|nr:hypothetical protein [Streptomyces spinoverrucosus]MBG0852021.1 hypothetical protein [Streptomyces spinoverrucosus]
MHPETHLALHHARATELRAEADAHRLALADRQTRDLRIRLGWTLVEVGLRMVATPKTATSVP